MASCIRRLRIWNEELWFAILRGALLAVARTHRTTSSPEELLWRRLDSTGSNSVEAKTVVYLRGRLRVAPWWMRGHIECAEYALRLGMISLAYGSAQAALMLASSMRAQAQIEYVLGRCYLRRGQGLRSIKYLAPLAEDRDASPDLLEETAAAYMTLGKYELAANLLMRIPVDEMSASAASTLALLRNKKE